MPPTIAVSGYYGRGNVGDEAILAGTAAGFRSADPEIRLIAFSADPRATQSLHGIEAVHRYSLPAVWAALRRSDLLLSGGGGLFQDATSLRSPAYYLAVVRMAALLGVPTMVFAQGIGPLRRPAVRRAARRVLEGVALVTVRDQASADALRDLGVSRPPIHVTADASLLIAPPGPQAARALQDPEGALPVQDPEKRGPSGSLDERQGPRGAVWEGKRIQPPPLPRIGVCLRPWRGATSPAWVASLRRALEEACQSHHASAVFIPMQRPGDLPLASQMAEGFAAPAAVLAAPGTPSQVMALIAEMDLVVAMRLHALIFAAATGVPCVGLGYDPKVQAFLETVGQPCLDLHAEPHAVAEAIRLALDRRDERAAEIAAAIEPLRRAAARNVELALALLSSR